MKLLMHLSALPDASQYRHFADLAAAQAEGEHFRVTVERRPGAQAAILAPHGGRIEDGTSEIAREIARSDHHLYLLEGLRTSHNFHTLHLTSHRFDEPRCLSLLTAAEDVVAVHGCGGDAESVYLGGRDRGLCRAIAEELVRRDIRVETEGHRFPGLHADNICNRGRRGAGVQLEITHRLRRSSRACDVASSVRTALWVVRGHRA